MSSEKFCIDCTSYMSGIKCPTCTNLSNWECGPTNSPAINKAEGFFPNKEILGAFIKNNRKIMTEKTPSEVIRLPLDKEVGLKFDTDKIDWTLMPWAELEQVLMILEFGAKKYARDNWKKIEPERYEKAAMRHLISYVTGELNDPESGKSHLAHLVCNALFLMWNDNNQEPVQ